MGWRVTWVRLDDRFGDHPKIFRLSDKAFRAHVLGLCYCAKHQTDGYVPTGFAADRATAELVAAGIWEPVLDGSGFQIHDYLVYNLSRDEWQELRQKRSKAGSKGAAKRWQRDDKPIAEPEPEPEVPTSKAPPTAGNAANPVTHDELYLAERIEDGEGEHISPAAIQKLNTKFGTRAVEDAMRRLHGFPPQEPIGSIYAFLESLCQMGVSA